MFFYEIPTPDGLYDKSQNTETADFLFFLAQDCMLAVYHKIFGAKEKLTEGVSTLVTGSELVWTALEWSSLVRTI